MNIGKELHQKMYFSILEYLADYYSHSKETLVLHVPLRSYRLSTD